MSLNIIDLIKGQCNPSSISKALEEREANVSKAIEGLVPVIVGGLANNSNNPAVLDAITNASSNRVVDNLLNDTNNSWISTLLYSILGGKVKGLFNIIADYAGISNHSSNSLLMGISLASIGKYADDHNLEKSEISILLKSQRKISSASLPAGLSLAF